MEKRAQIFVTHAIRILPEGVQYLIPQDPSDARRVHSLWHGSGFHAVHLILALVASQLLWLKWNNDLTQLVFKRKLSTHSTLQIHSMLSVYLHVSTTRATMVLYMGKLHPTTSSQVAISFLLLPTTQCTFWCAATFSPVEHLISNHTKFNLFIEKWLKMSTLS